jgi:hypothetical protein
MAENGRHGETARKQGDKTRSKIKIKEKKRARAHTPSQVKHRLDIFGVRLGWDSRNYDVVLSSDEFVLV